MIKAGVWMDRALGFIVPTAPLLVSAWATIQVGQDEPLKMGWIAIAFTLGLEGSVWYLNRLREAFKLENDGTFSFNVAIGGIITLIFGLLAGHAIWNSAGRQPLNIHVPGVEADVPLSEVMPAIAIALMSAIGAFVWAKKAAFKHRARLRAMNQIDPRAPKFATGRWVFAPRETICALRHSFRYGISEAPLAVSDWRTWKATGKPAIWPVPPGFRYDAAGKLVQLTIEELRDTAERDTLVATLTGRDTNGTALRDTPTPIAGHATAGRPALPHGTRDTGTGHGNLNGTARPTLNGTPANGTTGQHGTPDGTTRTGHGTRDTAGERDTDGTPDHGDGTPHPEGHGTRDTDGTRDGRGTPTGHGTRDETDELADVLKYAEHLVAVTEKFRDTWMLGPPPTIRKITAAIDEHRRRKDGGSYNSNATSAKVRDALVKLRDRPELLDVMRVQQEGDG